MAILILVTLLVLVAIALFFWNRRKRRLNSNGSSSTTDMTTMTPPLANPTGLSGYLFAELLEKYTLADLKNMEAVALHNEKLDAGRSPSHPAFGTGRCATAIASLCFATIEQVGLILRNHLNPGSIRNALKQEGRDNAESFFSFFASQGLQAVARPELDAVYFLFRNKITHNLFPRYSLGVSFDSTNSTTQMVIPTSGASASHSLNVNFLLNYLKLAIPLLENILSNTTSHAQTILLVEHNARLIDAEETRVLHDTYRSNPHIHSYYRTWLPHITF